MPPPSPILLVLASWLVFNLTALTIAWLRFRARERALRAEISAMIDAAERYANSQAPAPARPLIL